MKLLQKAAMIVAVVAGLAGMAPVHAEDKATSKDIVLKGDARCTSCHDEADSPQLLAIGKTRHGTRADGRTPTCTNCHGESNSHADYKGSAKPPKPDVTFTKDSKNPAPQRNEACLTCHQGGKHINWQSSTHANRDVACTSCHTVHKGHDKVRDKKTQTEVCYACHKEQRAQMNRPSHHPVPEGKLACTSCHDVHSDNPKALIKSSTNDTCYTCHMEKRGPFVHNHQPVTEDCAICHQPHGTSVPNLLKQRAPFLCQQCHSNTMHPANTAFAPGPGQAPSPGASVAGRSCNNCHTNIHGSNSTQSGPVGLHGTAGHFRR